MEISTADGQTVKLTNGRDVVRLRARSALRLGDDDPTTPQPNFTVLRGALDTTVGDREEPFAVDAERLTATFENAKVTVSDGDGNSAVYVTQGTATATSKATGSSAIVPPGTLQVVRRQKIHSKIGIRASRTRSSKCTGQFSWPLAQIRPRSAGFSS